MKQDLGRKKAVALGYDQKHDHAPKIKAVGKGLVAENIITKAKESNIPILDDPSLVELLAQLNINDTIPEELYAAVAEVFAYIYRIDQSIESAENGPS